MKCRHAKKLIFDYIDGMISDQDRIGLERHLGDCRSCEEIATGMNKSLDLLHRLPPVEPDENFNWKLRLRLAKEKNAIHADTGSERLWFKWWNTRFALSALSAFVVVVATGFIALQSGFGPRGAGTGSTAEPGIEWGEMPRVAGNTQNSVSGARSSTPATRQAPSRLPYLSFSFGGGPRLVAASDGGAIDGYDPAARRSNEPMIDLDSLRASFFHSRRETHRIRQLEQEVELLQSELEKCSAAQGAGADAERK